VSFSKDCKAPHALRHSKYASPRTKYIAYDVCSSTQLSYLRIQVTKWTDCDLTMNDYDSETATKCSLFVLHISAIGFGFGEEYGTDCEMICFGRDAVEFVMEGAGMKRKSKILNLVLFQLQSISAPFDRSAGILQCRPGRMCYLRIRQ